MIGAAAQDAKMRAIGKEQWELGDGSGTDGAKIKATIQAKSRADDQRRMPKPAYRKPMTCVHSAAAEHRHTTISAHSAPSSAYQAVCQAGAEDFLYHNIVSFGPLYS